MKDKLDDKHVETFTLPLVLIFEARDGALMVGLCVEGDDDPRGVKYVPLPLFKSDEQRVLFQELVKSKFLEFLSRTITGEAWLHLADMVELAAADVGLDVWADKDREHAARQIIGAHLGHTAARLRDVLEIADLRGRRSKWTEFDLRVAVKNALLGLPAEKQTYQFIAQRLKRDFPDKAPKNKEALRTLMRSYGISLESLRGGV
jgi:hypothetical protein